MGPCPFDLLSAHKDPDAHSDALTEPAPSEQSVWPVPSVMTCSSWSLSSAAECHHRHSPNLLLIDNRRYQAHRSHLEDGHLPCLQAHHTHDVSNLDAASATPSWGSLLHETTIDNTLS